MDESGMNFDWARQMLARHPKPGSFRLKGPTKDEAKKIQERRNKNKAASAARKKGRK